MRQICTPVTEPEAPDQEGKVELVRRADHLGGGEPALLGHQVVSGDGSGDSDAHAGNLPCAGPAFEAQSAVQIAVTALLLLASVTGWYLFPLSRDGNTVSS